MSGVPSTFSDDGDLLKKALLQFPRRYQHEFNNAARVDLRRVLCFASSHRGLHMRHLFSDVDDSLLPKTWAHVLVPERFQHLEKEEIYFERESISDISHPNRPCGRKFKRGESIYRCITCGKDESSGLCANCFDEQLHAGHDVVTAVCSREIGGVCDCGDSEGWKVQCYCKHQVVKEVPEEDIPPDFKASLLQTFEIVLDYIVDVMAGSSTTFLKDRKQDSESILRDSFRSSLNSDKYFGTDWVSDKFYLMLYNDQNKQYRDAVQRICAATSKVEDFAFMVADEVNQSGRAKVLGSTHIDELLEVQKTLELTGLTSCIRSARDIFREDMCSEIMKWIIEICSGSIFGNYNIARTLLTKAFCRKWRMGISMTPEPDFNYPGALVDNKIPLLNRTLSSHTDHPDYWRSNLQPWEIDPTAAADCEYDTEFISSNKGNLLHGSRFQYLIYFDIRFWKGFRSTLHNLYNSIVTVNRNFRSVICAQYVDIHPAVLELFFLFDREPENSVMTSLNTQIFASSSNATLVAEHGALNNFLSAAYGFLTQMRVVRPENVDKAISLSPASFKTRRISQVFYDMCCVLLKTESYDKILTSDFINQVCDILELFQGRPTIRREAVEHVEYENNDYGLYFNMYSMISSLSEMVANLFLKAEPDVVRPLVTIIMDRLKTPLIRSKMFTGTYADSEIDDQAAFTFRELQTLEGVQSVVDFKVHNGTMSFLHPLHSFFALAVQYTKATDSHAFMDYDLNHDGLKYTILEYPLRVLVMLSQIKVGYWVRNGFGLKNQLHIYQSSGIRQSGFRRDLTSIQFVAANSPADFTLSTIFSRWGLLDWLKEDFGTDNDYDENTFPLMVEECLLFLIHILTETGSVLDPENTTERMCAQELIHTLCFKPMSFSKLCAELPDFLVHEKTFDLHLKRLTDYIPPKDENSVGTYRLKAIYFNEIDPYYIHYSSNKRDEAEKLLKEREAKKRGGSITDSFLMPRTPNLENTLFKNLYQITASKILVQFLRSCLKYIDHEGISKTESILNFALHFIHICIEGKNLVHSAKFSENIWSELRADHNEPFYYESVGSLLYKLLTDDTFASRHSKIRAIFHSLSEKTGAIDGYLKEQVRSFDVDVIGLDCQSRPSTAESEFEKRKRLAKERTQKILANFKKQQTKFVEKHKVEDSLSDSDMNDSDDGTVWKYPDEHCILCQMPCEDDIFGVVCHVNQSSSSRFMNLKDKYWTLKAFSECKNMDSEDSIRTDGDLSEFFKEVRERSVLGPSFAVGDGNMVNRDATALSCGHGMHYSCYQKYLQSSEALQVQITRTVTEDFENAEYVCPLCKSLGNCFIPILWLENKEKCQEFVKASPNWFEKFKELEDKSCNDSTLVDVITEDLVSRATERLLPKFKQIAFTDEACRDLDRVIGKLDSRVVGNMYAHQRSPISKLIANTIKSTEISLRGVDCPSGLITTQLSNQSLTTIRILLEFRKTRIAMAARKEALKETLDQFDVKTVSENLAKLQFLSSERFFESIVSVDVFDFIVSCFEIPNVSIYSIYRMGFVHAIIQSLSTALVQLKNDLFEGSNSIYEIPLANADPEMLEPIMQISRKLRDNHPIFDNLSDEVFENERFPAVLYTILGRSLTPFLRRVAIWSFGNAADVSGISLSSFSDSDGLECDRLCRYLNLPSILSVFENFTSVGSPEFEIFTSYVSHIQATDNELFFSGFEYPGVIQLIDLPSRIDDIFTKIIYKRKDLLNVSNMDPAICLFCGTILQLQKKSPGSIKGECNNHTDNECLSEVGMFLLPRQSSMLLLYRGYGSFHPIPYIDSHGDYDTDIRQAQLLTLNQKKYDQFIRHMWLEHNIPNYITRKLEGTLDVGGWETL